MSAQAAVVADGFAEGRGDAFGSLAAVFARAADAIAILGSNRELRYTNLSFDSFLLGLDRGPGCRAGFPLEAPLFRPLRAAFASALAQGAENEDAVSRCEFCVSYHQTVLTYVAAIRAIGGSSGSRGPHGERLFLLVLREAQVLRRERVAALCQLYSLTRAETRVLARFADGEDLAGIAQLLGISIHTIRLHMKVLLDKTGCARQSELMRLLGNVVTGRIRLEI
jgi:DNA-binding CsgD family transcriptional regulator